MIWIIIAVLAAIGIIIYHAVDGYYRWYEVLGLVVPILLICIGFGSICLVFTSAICDSVADKTYHITEDTEIYALRDNIVTEGDFFLGSGNIDGELNYFYVVQTDMGYTINHMDADNVYIQYTTDRCHLETYSYTFNSKFVRLIAAPMSERYIFYIPDGSIINNYSIDLS